MAPASLVCALILLAQTAGAPSTAEERYLADLRARIAKGDVEAEVALGNLYETGDTVPLDPAQAATLYHRAADKGHVGAQTNLATMYLEGYGVAQDSAQAVAWFQKAAASGNAIASFTLASMYDEGAPGVARDYRLAADWYRRAADAGLAIAQHKLGVMYRDGRGVARNENEALAWLRKASEGGHPDAQLDLGALLLARQGVDPVEAHMWLNLAASRWKHEQSRLRAAALRDQLANTMTSAQLAEAYRRATEWQDRHAWGR
jgi:TPR repeat protein